MEIEFVPRRAGWIRLLIGPETDDLMEISLSNVMHPFAELHTFFFHLVVDQPGLSRARIDEEGRIVTFKATPAKNPSHAKISVTRRNEELEFFCARDRAARTYTKAFRELVDGKDYGGFSEQALRLNDFETMFGNY